MYSKLPRSQGLSNAMTQPANSTPDVPTDLFADPPAAAGMAAATAIAGPDSPEGGAAEVKYGERAIAAGELTTFPNPRPGRRYDIRVTLPEFTCKCPFSGYPDFATLHLTYVPDGRVVELKALKLYVNGYRDRYISHEESANQILDDFVAACDPLEATLVADFNPRGNVHTVVEVRHVKAAPDSLPDSLSGAAEAEGRSANAGEG